MKPSTMKTLQFFSHQSTPVPRLNKRSFFWTLINLKTLLDYLDVG